VTRPPRGVAADADRARNHPLRRTPGGPAWPTVQEVKGLLTPVDVGPRPVAWLEAIIGQERKAELTRAADELRQRLGHRTVWNVSSTATGGGVAEMLRVLMGYAGDLGIGTRWMVITGDADFFALTKRLHNQIHGEMAGGHFSPAEAQHYQRMLAANAVELVEFVQPGDLVLLHDPQTAGLAAPLAQAGAGVAWRSHIGVDQENEATRIGWDFLRPHLGAAAAYVFSRREYVPAWMAASQVTIIQPSIDPISPKNQHIEDTAVKAILAAAGILSGISPDGEASFTRRDGTTGIVSRKAAITAEALPRPDDQLVVQVSRWDELKDMAGVMQGFAEYIAKRPDGYLVLAGPAVSGVTDDPEGAGVFADCLLRWEGLAPAVRSRIMLANLPLDDTDENAVMVNALQRQATVVVQKSLAEGFGLTVAEGMWKSKPVVGSAVGGIIDQITPGTGILLSDPTDLHAFGQALGQLLGKPETASRMGQAAHAHISHHYVGDLHLRRYAELFGMMLSPN
jgi:trehalose synthase